MIRSGMARGRAMAAVAVALSALLGAACGGTDDGTGAAGEGLQIVTTTTILGGVAGELVGGDGSVEALMAPGQDAHAFAPSARQASTVRQADLVIAIGLGLEENLEDLLTSAETDGVPVLRVGPLVDPLPAPDEDADEHADHGDEDGDPHVWLDPLRMADAVVAVASALADVAPGIDWETRGAQVREAILAAHDDAAALLDGVPAECRKLVTNHDALRYFAARYGFDVVGSVIPGTSTQAAPSAGDFARLAALIAELGVPAVFAETSSSTDLAETLSAEVGRDVAVVELYTESLGEPGSGADTYAGLIRTDAQLVADALADC